jgi:hypothetical protein
MSGRKYDIITQNVRTLIFETKSVIQIQRRYRTQYGKDPPSDNALRRWLKRFQETGSIVAAIEAVIPQMLDNAWREIEYRLDILTCHERLAC